MTKPRSEKHRAWKYGLTVEGLRALLARGCAACGSRNNLEVDHDHSCCPSKQSTCGKCVRDVLCGACNRALGMVNDDAERLRALADYADRWE